MIVSVSRRTDIPALYAEWFYRRLQDGEVLVPHPRNPHRYSRIALSPETVDLLLFWTKNPIPLMPYLDEISKMGYPFCFRFTITPYGADIEPSVPEKGQMIATFRTLSKRWGAGKMTWGYDPVILTPDWTIERQITAFRQMAQSLSGYTERCVFSFVDLYDKMKRSFRAAGGKALSEPEMEEIAAAFANAAAEFDMRLYTCSEERNFSKYGIAHSSCIDRNRVEQILKCPITAKKDSGQRATCGCIESVDIGSYDTCSNGCIYCYAVNSTERLSWNRQIHDPCSPVLSGYLPLNAVVSERKMNSIKISQLSLL